jgi:hypothetical protein
MNIEKILAGEAEKLAADLARYGSEIPAGGVTALVICEEAGLSLTVHIARAGEPTPTIPELLEEARHRIFGDMSLNGIRRPRARPRKGPLSIQLLPFTADRETAQGR